MFGSRLIAFRGRVHHTCRFNGLKKGRRMRTNLLVVLVATFTLALAGTAFGQDVTQDAYGGVLGNEVGNGGGTPTAQAELGTQATDTGSLPFTGFEAGLVALAGFGLVALGFAMRRSTRRASD
jgi:hypothetical protein